MNENERYQIISNEFADLIIEYSGNMDLLTRYPNSTYNTIDRRYAVVHIPVADFTPDSIGRYGYGNIPSRFGLVSSPSISSSGIDRIRNIPGLNLKGQGVLVGFVDTGIDYTNPVFKKRDNTTRIISIWDQTLESNNYPDDFYYGTVFTNNQINAALVSDNPYSIVPSIDEIGHGTILAGVAAGTEVPEQDFSGVVPDSDIVVVKLKQAKPYLKEFFEIPKSAICYQSNDIMFGVKFLLQEATRLKRPIAICIGVGSSLGDYGFGSLSNFLSFYSDTVGTAIVTPVGNEANRGHHYYSEIDPNLGYKNVELNVAHNTSGFTMELYAYPPANIWVDIFAPNGNFVARVPKIKRPLPFIQTTVNSTTISINNEARETIDEHLIVFRFNNPMMGKWRLLVYEELDFPTRFRAYLPMENFLSPGTFFYDSDNETTITAPGSSDKLITATAYNYINQSLYYYAGRGFTVLNFPKPDIAAPGVDVLSPTVGGGFARVTGSSIAAAHTTGVAAMLLELGIVRGLYRPMNTAQIKRLFIYSARRDPNLIYPNKDWGYGILDVYNAYNLFLDQLRNPLSAVQSCPEFDDNDTAFYD
jgi:subtilisin family serine protease